MWQGDIRCAVLCAALLLRPAPAPGSPARRPPRTMYAATMPLPEGVCTDPV